MVQYVVGWDVTTWDVVVPTKVLSVHKKHRQTRLQWTIPRRNWWNRQWRNFIFSDECRYCISTNNGRARVWQNLGEHYNENCVIETDQWSVPSIMVWRGIGLNSKLGPVVFQNLGPGGGNGVTTARYRDQVLTPNVVPHFNRYPNKTSQHSVIRTPIYNTDVYRLFF